MRTIIVKIESTNDVEVTAKTISDKWNFNLQEENKIKVTEIDICLTEGCNTIAQSNYRFCPKHLKEKHNEGFEIKNKIVNSRKRLKF